MATGSGSSQPPLDTIAGVVADAVRRSLTDLNSRASSRASSLPAPVEGHSIPPRAEGQG